MIGQQSVGRHHSAPDIPEKGYYGVPVIHGPHWKWLIVGYFFLGGISGASAVIASFSRLRGGPGGAPRAQVATYVSFLALLPCPPLLILDLGRPARFHNMLRVFKASSPMSVGTWALSVFGIVTTLGTMLQILDQVQPSPSRVSRAKNRPARIVLAILGAASGFLVAGYTGVLLAATAVPLWSKRPGLLGPLFLASAMTSGAAAIALVEGLTGGDNRDEADGLRAFETLAAIGEGMLLFGWLTALGPTARPITEGQLGTIMRHGSVGGGLALPLVLSATLDHLPHRVRRATAIVSSALTLAGGFALRYVVVEGGRRSADDAQATFELTG